MTVFEGSFLGDARRIDSSTRLECGVCWWVYDPAKGDDVWQVPAGTPFTELPAHWRCPKCDASQSQFMVVGHGACEGDESGTRASGLALRERVEALEGFYRSIDQKMRPLPVHNGRLAVEAIGFRRMDDEIVGIMITPWLMNLMIVPLDPEALGRPEGSKRFRSLPSGQYEFVAGVLDGVGPIEACSLFSPMDEFDDMAVARLVAEHAIEGAFEVPDNESAPPVPAEPSRRAFLTGAAG